MKIRIPRSIKGVTAALEGIGQLITAKDWERSALVYAVTEPGTAGRPTGNRSESNDYLSLREFADLGINGLRSAGTVSVYRQAWQTAVDEGYAKPAVLGHNVDLPDPVEHPFPPTGNGRGIADAFAPDATPAVKQEAARRLLADPEVAAIVRDPVAGSEVRRQIDEATDDRISRIEMQSDVKDAGDPVARRSDETIALLGLQQVVNRFNRDVAEILPKVGQVSDMEHFWLRGEIDRLEATVADLRFLADNGETRVDHELREMTK
jgi:hypothetical protein